MADSPAAPQAAPAAEPQSLPEGEQRRRAAESVYAYQSAPARRRLPLKGKIAVAVGLFALTAGAAVGCGFAVEAAQTHLDAAASPAGGK